jgi:hypothetical protein
MRSLRATPVAAPPRESDGLDPDETRVRGVADDPDPSGYLIEVPSSGD